MSAADYLNSAAGLTPEQLRQRRISKRGIDFNIMVLGENGIGKKSFINSLCGTSVFEAVGACSSNSPSSSDGSSADDSNFGLRIESYTQNVIEPNCIPIKLRVIATTNFGSDIENSQHARAVNDYLEASFQEVLKQEAKINRTAKRRDDRVHVALYFIRPTGRGLNEFDLDAIKLISKRVNLIPVIGKADSLTEAELNLNRQLIAQQLEQAKIDTFNFFDTYFEGNKSSDASNVSANTDDACGSVSAATASNSYDEEMAHIQHKVPFAIISSNDRHFSSRHLPWGQINIYDEELCDFKILKNILFGSHLQDFKELTELKKYEDFRMERLTSGGLHTLQLG